MCDLKDRFLFIQWIWRRKPRGRELIGRPRGHLTKLKQGRELLKLLIPIIKATPKRKKLGKEARKLRTEIKRTNLPKRRKRW